MSERNNIYAFFALLRAGLWERDVTFSEFGEVDFNEVYRLAEEQAVVGLVAAGMEHVTDVKIPQDVALTFADFALQIERRNVEMNKFIAKLIAKLRENDVNTLLLKGQGIAQCYKRPLWRACGDVDLFLSEESYKKAKGVLMQIASAVEAENAYKKHLAMTIGP